MTLRLLHSVFLFLFFLPYPPLTAQDAIPYHAEAEKTFESALKDYRAESFYAAADRFQDVIYNFPVNQRTTAAYIMAARAHIFAATPQRGLRLLEDFRDRYPASEYVPESWLISGDGSLAAKSPARAIICYLRAWEAGLPDTTLLESRLRALDRPALSDYDRRMIRGYLTLLPSEQRLAAIIGLDGARAPKPAAENIPIDTGAHVSAGDKAVKREPLPAVIAVALPEQPGDRRKERMVADLKRGIHAAWEIHAQAPSANLRLEFFDSGSGTTVKEMVRSLEANAGVKLLLAGAFTGDAREVCEATAERDLIVLLPTATGDSLTRLGSNIFQLNTPIEERARLLADFATLELDAAGAAVLAPDDSWPRAMAEAFLARATELGLPVTDAIYYNPEQGNIAAACKRLKGDAGAKNRILFAPVRSRGDIAQVLQGAKHSECTGTILGAGNWNHPDLLLEYGGDLTVYFESDVAPDSSCREMRALCRELGLRESGAITAEILFGYDAMRLALTLVQEGGGSQKEIRRRLRDVHEGLRAPVDFRTSRVNRAMNVLRYRDGRVLQLESFHAK